MKQICGFILLFIGIFFALTSQGIENDEEKEGVETMWPMILMFVGIALGCWGFWLMMGEYFVKPEI